MCSRRASFPPRSKFTCAPECASPTIVKSVADRIRTYQFIDDVRYGEEWVEKLYRLRNIATVAGIALGVAFAAVAVIIIGATIRMTVLARAKEISIMRLVGATDMFVRLPFLIDGLVKGVLGGLLALVFVWVANRVINEYFIQTIFFDREMIFVGIVGGAFMGVHREPRVGGETSTSYLRRGAIALACITLLVSRLPGQQTETAEARIRAQRDELERIRAERDELEQKMAGLQNTAHELADEVNLLDKQHDATARMVKSLDAQLVAITDEVKETTANLSSSEREAVTKRVGPAAAADRDLQTGTALFR